MTMRLNPKQPPGRANRKARLYAQEVRRLRAKGYTLEAIRRALFDAGISVSVSTVWREAGRPASLWDLAHADEAPRLLKDAEPVVQLADISDNQIDGADDPQAPGPFPDAMAALGKFLRPR